MMDAKVSETVRFNEFKSMFRASINDITDKVNLKNVDLVFDRLRFIVKYM